MGLKLRKYVQLRELLRIVVVHLQINGRCNCTVQAKSDIYNWHCLVFHVVGESNK